MKQSSALFTDVSEQLTASIDIVEPLYTYCLLYPTEIFPKFFVIVQERFRDYYRCTEVPAITIQPDSGQQLCAELPFS